MRTKFDPGQPFDENVARNTRQKLYGRPDQIAEGLLIGEAHQSKPGVTQALYLANAAELACNLAERVEKMVAGRKDVVHALHFAGGLHLELSEMTGYIPMSDNSFTSFGYKSRASDHAEAQGLWMAAQMLFNRELEDLSQCTNQTFAYLRQDFSRPDAIEAAAGIKAEAATLMKKASDMLTNAGLHGPAKLLDQAARQMDRSVTSAGKDITPPKKYLLEEVDRANRYVHDAVREQRCYDLNGVDPEDLKAPKQFRDDVTHILALLDGKRPDPATMPVPPADKKPKR